MSSFLLARLLPCSRPLPRLTAQDGGGNVVGEVHQRWHLWRRKYDLYIGALRCLLASIPHFTLFLPLVG